MRIPTILSAALLAAGFGTTAIAQPPDFAVYPEDEAPGHGRFREDHLSRVADYLDLSEAQATEWEAITAEHRQIARERRERIAQLRNEFRSLADQDNPDLGQIGRVALDLHREMESARASRGEVFEELKEILTPEQTDRFEALMAAREFSRDRGHRGRRGTRSPKDSG